jgi:hypothetical protein
MSGALGIIVLCVAAIILVGPRTQESPKESASKNAGQSTVQDLTSEKDNATVNDTVLVDEDEAMIEDAQWYAKDQDISLEEAIRRLKMMDDPLLPRLERDLRRDERDTFAGLWLRHQPDFGFTVAFTGDRRAARDKVRPYVEGTQWEATVKIKRVQATLVELNAARAEAERTLDRLRIAYSSGGNVFKNRMEIYVKNKARVERKLRASGLQLPEHVVLIESWIRSS